MSEEVGMGLNFVDWSEFFDKLNFTYFRTSLIQKKYIETVAEYAKKCSKEKGRAPHLLEIAAGSGYTSVVLSDLLRKTGANIFVSDLDQKVVDKMAEKFNAPTADYNVYFLQADSSNLSDFSKKNKLFDVVFHQGFLEHFDDSDIIQFLMEQASIAEYIIFDVPNGRRWNKYQEFGNERFLSHEKWIELAQEAGLEVVYNTARRFTNPWKDYVPYNIRESEWFHRNFGESSIIVARRASTVFVEEDV